MPPRSRAKTPAAPTPDGAAPRRPGRPTEGRKPLALRLLPETHRRLRDLFDRWRLQTPGLTLTAALERAILIAHDREFGGTNGEGRGAK